MSEQQHNIYRPIHMLSPKWMKCPKDNECVEGIQITFSLLFFFCQTDRGLYMQLNDATPIMLLYGDPDVCLKEDFRLN